VNTKRTPLLTIGMVMPEDFAIGPYESIHKRVSAQKDAHPQAWDEYAGGWNAVAYRFAATADHDTAFTGSVSRAATGAPHGERYVQERELFNFFANGLATINCFCYGIFAIASMTNAQSFPMATADDRRCIKLETTRDRFANAFPKENITSVLMGLSTSHELQEWRRVRNTLSHRSAPGRVVRLSTSGPSPDHWKIGMDIDTNTTAIWRQWLAETMLTLLTAADEFTRHYL
jgi:hypothetical protein